jgi:hypothetical protein
MSRTRIVAIVAALLAVVAAPVGSARADVAPP